MAGLGVVPAWPSGPAQLRLTHHDACWPPRREVAASGRREVEAAPVPPRNGRSLGVQENVADMTGAVPEGPTAWRCADDDCEESIFVFTDLASRNCLTRCLVVPGQPLRSCAHLIAVAMLVTAGLAAVPLTAVRFLESPKAPGPRAQAVVGPEPQPWALRAAPRVQAAEAPAEPAAAKAAEVTAEPAATAAQAPQVTSEPARTAAQTPQATPEPAATAAQTPQATSESAATAAQSPEATLEPSRVAKKEDLKVGTAVVDKSLAPSLFCYAVVLTAGVEQKLLATQLRRGTGIFGCHSYSVFSDHDVSLGPGGSVAGTAIPGEAAWRGPVPGSSQLVWHNTGVFARAWRRIQSDGIYKQYDWSVKVDPDTAFIPGILQRRLAEMHLNPSSPFYFVNCREWWSLQGPLEVLSRSAGERFFGGIGTCESSLPWRDWGEDWFVQHCLDMLGVEKREGFDLLDDMWCHTPVGTEGRTYWQLFQEQGPTCADGRPAFHPYKSTADMEACLSQALGPP